LDIYRSHLKIIILSNQHTTETLVSMLIQPHGTVFGYATDQLVLLRAGHPHPVKGYKKTGAFVSATTGGAVTLDLGVSLNMILAVLSRHKC
jgi:hypothetical protein